MHPPGLVRQEVFPDCTLTATGAQGAPAL